MFSPKREKSGRDAKVSAGPSLSLDRVGDAIDDIRRPQTARVVLHHRQEIRRGSGLGGRPPRGSNTLGLRHDTMRICPARYLSLAHTLVVSLLLPRSIAPE